MYCARKALQGITNEQCKEANKSFYTINFAQMEKDNIELLCDISDLWIELDCLPDESICESNRSLLPTKIWEGTHLQLEMHYCHSIG